jgi:hypothetical protein
MMRSSVPGGARCGWPTLPSGHGGCFVAVERLHPMGVGCLHAGAESSDQADLMLDGRRQMGLDRPQSLSAVSRFPLPDACHVYILTQTLG